MKPKCVTAPENRELNHVTERPKRGEENFRCIEGPSQWESISVPPDDGGSPLPPLSFFSAPCFPKQPFPLLPLRKKEQEGLGGGKSILVCIGGTISIDLEWQPTQHRMGWWLDVAFRPEVLYGIYCNRYNLKQAQRGFVCPFHGALHLWFLFSALPLQVVRKSIH